MTRAKISSEKMLEMANVFGKLTRRKTQFSNTKDYSQNAGTSIIRSILYSINVVETAFFDQHKIQNEVLSLQTALSNFSTIFDDRFSIINKQVEALQNSLLVLQDLPKTSTLPQPVTKSKNEKTRYIAAIVANCYRDKFERWPITPAGNPKREFITTTEQICKILDTRNLYGISGACEDFAKNPWELWDKSPPSITL